MASLNDLIQKIENPELRARIEEEIDKLAKQKKFGLVFEEHLPESSFLYDIPVKKGVKVARKTSGKIADLYTVLKIHDGVALCLKNGTEETEEIAVDELCAAAQFGDPIYPCLESIDSVCNAPESSLWHTLIEADNYHALQLLAYLYKGKVDCIYIDPPYNTGAKDWKYNNDYVDKKDLYRHSKWLSMMQKRLKLAKKLLNPNDSVLIVTIDEKEYLHLGCLLEELFPDARRQMLSITMNHAGTGRKNEFARVNEFAFYVSIGKSKILPEYEYGESHASVLWDVLRRSELCNTRDKTDTQFYPIFIDDTTGKIHSVGMPIEKDVDINTIIPPDNCTAVFPIRDDGIQTMWGCCREELIRRIDKGYIRVGDKTTNKPQKYSLSYLKTGPIADIENGLAIVEGYARDGSVQAYYQNKRKKNPPSVIESPLYDARIHGSGIIEAIIGRERFSYPKSLYAVKDCLKFVVANKPDALIVDFFAGSGTTLHAVNLLNAEDGGFRRCILVTNNEVSDAEAKEMTAKGFKPGDEEWERLGIARYVTWPRTVCSIEGHDVNGKPLEGVYMSSEIPMSDGFQANAAFFKLRFLDKNRVALGRQFKELLSTLWLKAGAFGKCPTIKVSVPDMLILPENRMAILNDENQIMEFVQKVKQFPEIETIFFVTDYESVFFMLSQHLPNKTNYQLYRDYLDNFIINTENTI
ncbi:MAG: hypothetical protein IJH67_04710 [Thermoguttaceae bacterium]|nr:hypothetical protein [Thermoguttaceae bacterium]